MSQQYFVCSDHFIHSQFADDSRQRLSNGAVPTLFDFNSQNALPVEIIYGDEIIVEGEYVCVYVPMSVCIYVVCVYVCVCTYVCVYLCCVCVCVCAHMYTNVCRV